MRALDPGTLLSLPRVGDPVVGGGPSKCTSSLWSQFSDCLPGHEVLHIPPDSCSFIVWNMEKKIV